MKKPILIAFATMVMVTLACGFTINLPVDEITTGPTQKANIYIPYPKVDIVDLTISFGAGELEIAPGASDALVTGKATFNVDEFIPDYTVDGSKVKLQTGNLEIKGIPKFKGDIENHWELSLGNQPMQLTIQAGAYQGDLELGGLALRMLDVADGAAEVRMKFSQPNSVEMNSFRYSTGASSVELIGLANANFTSMIFRSGAGNYKLDFSGNLRHDAVVTIESGISQVVIIVPEHMAAHINFKGGLTKINTFGNWQSYNDQYILEGAGPVLTINVDMGAGNLELRTSP